MAMGSTYRACSILIDHCKKNRLKLNFYIKQLLRYKLVLLFVLETYLGYLMASVVVSRHLQTVH